MRLYNEIFSDANGMAQAVCVFTPAGGGYFEGVKAVGDFSPEAIFLHFPKTKIEVRGEDLTIKKYCDGDLQLSGKIFSVRLATDESTEKDRRK